MPATLRLFIKILKYLGLMSVSLDPESPGFQLKYQISYYVYHGLMQALLLLSFVVLLNDKSIFFGMEKMDTGNYYNFISLQVACIVYMILNAWLILKQRSHLRLLDLCQQWSAQYLQKEPEMYHMYSRSRLVTFVAALLLNAFNLLRELLGTRKMSYMIQYLPWIMYAYRFVTYSTVSSLYLEVVIIVRNVLDYISHTCENLLRNAAANRHHRDLSRLQELLNFHDAVILVATEEINCIYGVSILLCTFIIILESIWDVYFMAITGFGQNLEQLQHLAITVDMIMWILPLVMFLCMGLVYSDLMDKAYKTSKILARCPRGNSGVDKMISKFLLKNLRRKPILTAYGYFSLDKGALFKLFTAIFTYMVILVQFKDLENNTKKFESDFS